MNKIVIGLIDSIELCIARECYLSLKICLKYSGNAYQCKDIFISNISSESIDVNKDSIKALGDIFKLFQVQTLKEIENRFIRVKLSEEVNPVIIGFIDLLEDDNFIDFKGLK